MDRGSWEVLTADWFVWRQMSVEDFEKGVLRDSMQYDCSANISSHFIFIFSHNHDHIMTAVFWPLASSDPKTHN